MLLAKVQEKIVRREICNATTCNKCVHLFNSKYQKENIKKLCYETLNLRKCCPDNNFLLKNF